MPHDSTHMRSLESSHSWRQKIRWWGPGTGEGDGEFVFNGDEVPVLLDKEFGR